MSPPQPALPAQAQDYLRAVGITDPATWAAFRLGQVTDADLARLLTTTQRRGLRPSGIWLPTCDPRDPGRIVGLVRLAPAQHKHDFIGAPAGLAAPSSITAAARVVLVDQPLLGLRLHQLGVPGIAIVEDLAVLPPLADWLAAREVVTITTAKRDDLALPTGIVPVGAGRIACGLDQAPAAVLALLGLDPATLRLPLAPLPLDPRLPQQLHAYAERMLATAAGQAALAALDLDRPEILAAYRPGFLPGDYRQALRDDQRRMLLGRDLGGCIVLPAFDAQGSVVDLVAMKPRSNHVIPSLWEAPRGVCAPVLATASEHLCLTTVVRWVGRLFREVGPTALLRDLSMVAADAARCAAGGVRTVEVRTQFSTDADTITAAFQTVGIEARIVTDEAMVRAHTVGRMAAWAARRSSVGAPEAPAPAAPPTPAPAFEPAPAALPAPAPSPAPLPADLVLVRHDAQAETAVFQRGEAVYTVQVPWGGRSTVALTLTLGAASHRDRFDLAVAPQRLRFAAAASHRVHLPPAEIARDLERLLPMLLRIVEVKPAEPVTTTATVPGMSAVEHATALALLRDGGLVERLLADLDALGAGGEPDAALVVLLAAISRLGDEPVWACLTATAAAERFPVLGILAAITPPEHLLHVSRLTDNALFHGDRDALAHKLLVLDDLGGISTAAATALKVLYARGVLTGTQVQRDAVRGRMRTTQVQAQGPLALVTATTTSIPALLVQHVVEVAVDESPAQAERLCAARQRPPVDTAPIISRLVAAQRLLRVLPVTIPAEVAVPVIISRHRALHAPFFGLVAASALLHQYQRPVLDGRLVATAADAALASRAVLPLVGQVVSGLNYRAQAALAALTCLGSATFGMADLKRLLPDMTRSTLRRALDDLVEAECVVALRGRQGSLGEYRVLAGAAPPVHLSTLVHEGWTSATREMVNG